MYEKKEFIIGMFFIVGFLAACSAVESDSQKHMGSFSSSLCKKVELRNSLLISSLSRLYAEDQFPGLKCISWKKAENSLYLDLSNFEQGCGTEWEGSIEADDSKIILNIDNPKSAVANCGWCTFDWSFEAINLDLESDKELLVKIDTYPDGSYDDVKLYNARLNTGSADSGVICRWANWYALEEMAESVGTVGTLHMPCSEDTEAPCKDDLVCEKADESDSKEVCLSPCEEDADCMNEDILYCKDGICLLRQIWEP